MRLIFLFRRFVFAQVMLGVVAFCMAERNPGLLMGAGAIAALSWYVTEGPRGQALPRWAINSASLLAVIWLGFDLYWQEGSVVVAMGHFTMVLQILLLYTHKSNREYGQLLVLSLMLMIGASILSVSMIYGLLLAAYCVLALVTLLLFHLKSTNDQVMDAHRAASFSPVKVVRPASVVGRHHTWHFRIVALVIGLGCATVAAAVFVVMPRSEEGPMSQRYGRSLLTPRAGFSNEVNLRAGPPGDGAKEPVLNLVLAQHGENVGRDGPSFLLRGAALDRYQHHRSTWTRSQKMARHDRPLTVGKDGASLAPLPGLANTIQGTVTLRQTGHRTLFTVLPSSKVDSDNLLHSQFNPIDQMLQTPQAVTGAVVYRITWPLYPPGDMNQRYLEAHPLPLAQPDEPNDLSAAPGAMPQYAAPIDPVREYARGWAVQPQRVARLARHILKQASLERDPLAWYTPEDGRIARVLANHLREHYQYSLKNPATPGRDDPTIAFLFDHQQGHCELFASALAALTRSLGMQSRVVTGYRASEFNSVGGYYVVRQSHAHAWTEVNLGPQRGWHTYDATPPDRVNAQHRSPRTWLTGLREVYEYMEFAWIRSVVAYDQRTRRAVIAQVGQSMNRATHQQSLLGRVGRWIQELPDRWNVDRLGYTAAGVTLIFLMLAVGSLIRLLLLRRRRWVALQIHRLPRAHRRGLTRQLRFYLTMLEMLERHGHVRPGWQSPFAFAQELASQHPMRFDPVVALTEIFYEIRFGHRSLDNDRQQRVKLHLKRLEHTLANRIPEMQG